MPSLKSCSPRRLVELNGYDHFYKDLPSFLEATLQKREIEKDVNGRVGHCVGIEVSVDRG
jgi:hypothetical protein